MTTDKPVIEWTQVSNRQWISLCGKYRITEMSGRVIRQTAGDFPIRSWYYPTEFPTVAQAMAAPDS